MKSPVFVTIHCILASSILMVGACKHREEPRSPIEVTPPQVVRGDKPSVPIGAGPQANSGQTPAGEVLPLEGLRFAQFADYDAHERCTALKDFSDTFVRLYGESAQISNWTCEQFLIVNEMHYTIKFILTRDNQQKNVRYYMTRGEKENFLQLSVNSIASNSDGGFHPELANLSPRLGHWQVTLEAFLKGINPAPMVFGKPWSDFVNAVTLKLHAEGLSMKKRDTAHTVKLTLQPGRPDNKAAGSVRFDEVPEALLIKTEAAEPVSGTTVVGGNAGLLGCLDKTCLNDGSVEYLIVEDSFVIWRKQPATGSARSTMFQSVRFQTLPE